MLGSISYAKLICAAEREIFSEYRYLHTNMWQQNSGYESITNNAIAKM